MVQLLIPNCKQIFDEIVLGTPNFNAKNYEHDTACTSGMFELFSKLGKSFGHLTVPKVSKKDEFLTIDLLWKSGEDIILAYEHENIPKTNPIDDEWRKLVNIKAKLKILISYQSNPETRKTWISNASQIIKSNNYKLANENYMLVLGSICEGKSGKDPFIKYYAYVFDNRGNLTEEYQSDNIPMNCSI